MVSPRREQAGPRQDTAGPWPYAPRLLQPELQRYLADAASPAAQHLPTPCTAWTVREVTIHLLCTFSRFRLLLTRGRAGDFSPPFPPGQLAEENQQAVRQYQGSDPCGQLQRAVEDFAAALGDGDELMPHQLGPIPVALQVLFGINELAIHHHDVAAAAGHRYQPPTGTLAVLQILWQRRHSGEITNWPDILRASGRIP